MTNDKIAALKAAAEAATPGPWNIGDSNQGKECVWLDGLTEPDHVLGSCETWIDCNSENNAAFISKANPQAILSLIGRIEAAEKVIGAAKALSDNAEECIGADGFTWFMGPIDYLSDLNPAIDAAMGADHEHQ